MKKCFSGTVLAMFFLAPVFSMYCEQEPTTPNNQEADAGAASKGIITPRASAARYAAHGELEGIAVGAALLTPEEVRQAFSTDLNRCCFVVEVALYPEKGTTPEIARRDFSLRIVGTDVAAKPSSPNLLAMTLQLTAPGGRDAGLHGSVGVTYGLGGGGYDPARGGAGQPRLGRTSTSADVGNEPEMEGSGPKLTDADREFMELELTKKGLPEGKISAPVAGYLYFPLTRKLKKKKAVRQLEFTLVDRKVALTLP